MSYWDTLDLDDAPRIKDRDIRVREIVHVARSITWDGELPNGPLSIYHKWNLKDEQIRQALEYYLENPSRVDVDHVDGDVKRIRRILHKLDWRGNPYGL